MLAEGGTMLSLKTMTESKLIVLKREIEATIHAKVTARRREIESELSRLSLLDGSARAKVVKAAARGMDAAKYRSSAPTRKAAGRRVDESLIAPIVSISGKQPKKSRKTKKVPNTGDVVQPALLTSAQTDHTEPGCIEPPSDPIPIQALSGASLYPNNTPGDLGGDPIAAVTP
jgi:hypothetical protein